MKEHGNYVIVVPVPAHRLDEHRFAIESAFAEHLRMLRGKLGEIARRIVVVSPRMPLAEYARGQGTLAVVDEEREGIRFRPAHEADVGKLAYMRELARVMAIVYREVKDAGVVHASPSPLFRPFELPALLLARALGKKTVSVTDIDHRNSARMAWESGQIRWKQYLLTRLLHQPFMDVQHRIVARACSLVLLKGRSLAATYGEGRENVHDFLDSAFAAEHIIDEHMLEEKARALRAGPARLTYFGRLVAYKGVDHMLRALAGARALGADAELHLVGSGTERARLESLTDELGLRDRVVFHGAVPFGAPLFALLREFHVLLAAPLWEDTPRSALDALASGQSLVAYDSAYYRELAAAGAPIDLVPWNDVDAFARTIAVVVGDRERLARRMQEAIRFARDNTQEIWLERRAAWTRALFDAQPERDVRPSTSPADRAPS